MQLERHVLCEYDYVQILTGDEEQFSLGKFCEDLSEIDSVYISNGNVMIIEFWSDELITKKGFRALIKVVKSKEREVSIFECDFTNSFCDMSHDDDSTIGYLWNRHQGETFTHQTGPQIDASMRERGDDVINDLYTSLKFMF